jgi:hypothetical protein
MEIRQGERLKGQKYLGVAMSALLVMGFVVMQPAIQKAYAVDVEGLPGYDDCHLKEESLVTTTTSTTEIDETTTVVTSTTVIVTTTTTISQPEDPISANTIRNGKIVKTIFAEKEIFNCKLNQGDLDVIADVTLYIELYENIAQQKVIGSNAVAITCLKDEGNSEVIDCESEPVPAAPIPVGDECVAQFYITHPMEMDTIVREDIGKTVQVDKEVFICPLDNGDTVKKVEIIIFAEVYENLKFQFVEDTQFHAMRCVVLITNDRNNNEPEDTIRDARVETCQFSSAD